MPMFKICVRNPRADGSYVVYIRLTHNRSMSYLKTSFIARKQDVKAGEVTNAFINRKCSEMIDDFTDRCNRVDVSSWDCKDLVDYLMNEGDKIMSFSDYCRVYTRRMDNEGRETTSQNYKLAIARLEEFSGKEQLEFRDITSRLINSWIESMKDSKYKRTGYPKAIKAMFNRGCEEINDYDRGIIRIHNQPFRRVDIPRPKKPLKRAMDVLMLQHFFSADVSTSKPPKGATMSRSERALDVCMLVFCLAGINTADLYDLRSDSFVNGKLCYNRKKTRAHRDDEAYMEIVVPKILMPLFEKHKGRKRLFNFCEIYATQKGFNKAVNLGMEEIRTSYNSTHEDKIEYMSTYSLRHSWATIAQNKCGASIELIAFSLNHGSAHKVTERYIAIDYSPISDLNQMVVNVLFPP